MGPPPDTVYPIGPGPSARPPPPRPGGVTTVESWTGNCYYCSTEIVDELIDVLNQGGAAGGGGAVLAGLKKYPQLAAIFGGYAAAAVWMGAHINRVRREAARNCRPGETAGVKICIVGVYSTGVWVTVEPYCYVPR